MSFQGRGNFSLDSVGGPNHLGNMCDSPLLAVPHRAKGADDIPSQLDFELAGHPFGKVHGDKKTREELNAEGVPAKYLDLGIVVQPMYYYVGHITKFVRLGSKAADRDLGGLMLITCNATAGHSGFYEVVSLAEKHRANIVLKNSKMDSSKSCLVVQPLRNSGGAYGPRGGAQVNIGRCDDPWAEWVFDHSTGEIYSTVFEQYGGEVCLTTGWPFLQVGAFDTSATGKSARAAVVVNEAGETANYVFKNKGKTILTASIPPHSIQTISFD
ncbi:hypothetical protein ACHAWF_015042 [Thalassiosira exigua]